MRRAFLGAAVVLVLAALALAAGPPSWRGWLHVIPRQAPHADLVLDGVAWREAAAWEFRDGPFPKSWSWGRWRIVDGVLEGRDDDGRFAVYMCPCEHGPDFLLEARVRIPPDSAGRLTEAHLLTRDSRELHSESGAVIFGGQPRMSARHMVEGRDYVLRVIRPPEPVREDVWHVLRYAVYGGRVSVWLDGARLYRSERRYPAGTYREPHLAVRNGRASFSDFRVYVAP